MRRPYRISLARRTFRERPYSETELALLGRSDVPEGRSEIRLFARLRNEALRLPFFVQYYEKLGIDRFFLVDNGSSDRGCEPLLEKSNVHVFSTHASYAHSSGGLSWIEQLVAKYGMNRWCVFVDIDELFLHPEIGTAGLRGLVAMLGRREEQAVRCLLVDIYGKGPFAETEYRPGTDPTDVAPYFDGEGYEVSQRFLLDPRQPFVTGGMRRRVFGVDVCLDKVPLLFMTEATQLSQGHHLVRGSRVASTRGALLHSKYLQDFRATVGQELERGQRFAGSSEYAAYARTVSANPDLTAYCALSKPVGDRDALWRSVRSTR